MECGKSVGSMAPALNLLVSTVTLRHSALNPTQKLIMNTPESLDKKLQLLIEQAHRGNTEAIQLAIQATNELAPTVRKSLSKIRGAGADREIGSGSTDENFKTWLEMQNKKMKGRWNT